MTVHNLLFVRTTPSIGLFAHLTATTLRSQAVARLLGVALALLVSVPLVAGAQYTIEVPSEIKFANMKLELTPRRSQKDTNRRGRAHTLREIL